MAKKQTNPNSLANLRMGKDSGIYKDPRGAALKGAESKRRKADFRKAINEALERGEITTIEQISEKFLKEVDKMNKWAVELFWEISQNFKNRELKIKDKSVLNQERVINHLEKLKVVNPVETGETIPYEEVNREIE